jgi:hypothetical protein
LRSSPYGISGGERTPHGPHRSSFKLFQVVSSLCHVNQGTCYYSWTATVTGVMGRELSRSTKNINTINVYVLLLLVYSLAPSTGAASAALAFTRSPVIGNVFASSAASAATKPDSQLPARVTACLPPNNVHTAQPRGTSPFFFFQSSLFFE